MRDQLEAKRRTLEEFEAADPSTTAAAELIGRKIEKLRPEVTDLEERIKELTPRPPATNRLDIEPGATLAGVWAAWSSAPVTVQREIARDVCSPNALGIPLIMRMKGAGRRVVSAEDRIILAQGPEDVPPPASGPVPRPDWTALLAAWKTET